MRHEKDFEGDDGMRFTRKLAAVAAVCAAVCGGALTAGAPASAAPRSAADGGWTVAPGGAFSAMSTSAVMQDTTTGTAFTCSLSASGALMSGSGLPGSGIGDIGTVSAFTCSGPLGITMTCTAGHLPWVLNASGYDAATDVTTGTLTGVSLHWSGLGSTEDFDGPGGAGSGTGSVDVTYDNSDHQLRLSGGNLRTYNSAGTFLGLINDGDAWSFTSALTVTPAQTIRPDGAVG